MKGFIGCDLRQEKDEQLSLIHKSAGGRQEDQSFNLGSQTACLLYIKSLLEEAVVHILELVLRKGRSVP